MSLVKWSPFFDQFEEMDKMFSNISPAVREVKNTFVPAIDMYEDDDSVIVETQLAGIDSDNVSISIENDVLCIKGKGEKKSEVDDKNYYRKEIRRGNFYRSIQLPSHVDGNKAKAQTDGGVLKIIIPKVQEQKLKTIKIEKK